MTDQTESASENAELLRDLEHVAAFPLHGGRVTSRAASAIRALEAKVREKTADAESHLRHERMWRTRAQEAFTEIARLQKLIVDEHVADEAHVDELTADRDRLAGEVERLTTHVSRLEHANDTAFAEVARLAAEVLVAQTRASEVTSELAAARENGHELMYLLSSAWFYGAWHAETFNERRMQLILERNGYWPTTEATLITHHEAIDAARSAGGEG